jgi:hypothetical protein
LGYPVNSREFFAEKRFLKLRTVIKGAKKNSPCTTGSNDAISNKRNWIFSGYQLDSYPLEHDRSTH